MLVDLDAEVKADSIDVIEFLFSTPIEKDELDASAFMFVLLLSTLIQILTIKQDFQ